MGKQNLRCKAYIWRFVNSNYMQKFILSTIFSVLISFTLSAQQTATIRGTVSNASSGEAIIFGVVYLEGTSLGVQTDINGFYSLTKIPAGAYTLVCQQSGFEPTKLQVSVKAGQILNQNISLKEKVMKEVIITSDKTEKEENVQISTQTMDPKTINIVPSIGGIADIAQSVQVLPGVISTGDQGGQLYIRGGSPIQNKVLMDGMIIYNPFHSIGLFSVFDTDVIKNMDVYTGGFNADFGGRISSVMDITTRDGNKKRFGGKVTASPFGSKLMLEGPIRRMNEENQTGSISYVLSAKNSYLRQTSKALYSYIDTNGLPFNFNDYYGKVAFNSPNGSKLNIFGFFFDDTVSRFRGSADLKWKALGFGSNFQVVPGSSTTLIRGNFAYSKYDIGMREDFFQPRNSSIDGFNMGLNFTYFERKNVINYGIEVLGFTTAFNFRNAVNRLIEQNQSTTEFAAYVKYKWVSKETKLILEPGFRVQYYASLNNVSPEPRLGFKYNITKKFRMKGATGMYSQNLISAVSDRDVVNLFYGFLSGSDNLPRDFTTQAGEDVELTHKLQKANHFIFGFEWDPIDSTQKFGNLTINIEGYIKQFTQLTNLNRNKLYEDDETNANIPDQLKKDFIIETGNAYGIDFLMKYEKDRLYLWAVYSLGYVRRWDGIQQYRPHFDRRHNVNLVGAYRFGKHDNWEVDVRWNFGSGLPFTPTAGFFENITFQNLTTDYTSQNGSLGIIYGGLNSRQLPTYHRLDMSIKKWWEFSEFSKLEVAFSITNAYNRANIFYIDRVTFNRVDQLPFMPSLSANYSF
jgi:CarboxypepD_reg-like domain/TonB-dependent Receptor Plug Domain